MFVAAGRRPSLSGTVAGAREAACKGVPALAVSLDTHNRGADYDAAAVVTVRLVQAFLATNDVSWLSGTVVNVNIPPLPLAALQGFALTRQARLFYLPRHICATSPPRATCAPPASCPAAKSGQKQHCQHRLHCAQPSPHSASMLSPRSSERASCC